MIPRPSLMIYEMMLVLQHLFLSKTPHYTGKKTNKLAWAACELLQFINLQWWIEHWESRCLCMPHHALRNRNHTLTHMRVGFRNFLIISSQQAKVRCVYLEIQWLVPYWQCFVLCPGADCGLEVFNSGHKIKTIWLLAHFLVPHHLWLNPQVVCCKKLQKFDFYFLTQQKSNIIKQVKHCGGLKGQSCFLKYLC